MEQRSVRQRVIGKLPLASGTGDAAMRCSSSVLGGHTTAQLILLNGMVLI
jgi:hypothetical protein